MEILTDDVSVLITGINSLKVNSDEEIQSDNNVLSITDGDSDDDVLSMAHGYSDNDELSMAHGDSDDDVLSMDLEENLENDDTDSELNSVNNSDIEDDEFISIDNLNIDFKVNKSEIVNNLKWMSYECDGPVCVSQYYYIVVEKKVCSHCFFDIFSQVNQNIGPQHITNHFTGTYDSIYNFLYFCSACSTKLFITCMCKYCTTCNSIK